jgi:hypothetical protein
VEKSRLNGSNNPYAHFTDPTTIEDVLSARTIADPLTLPMCSPVSDDGPPSSSAPPSWLHGGNPCASRSAPDSGKPWSKPTSVAASSVALPAQFRGQTRPSLALLRQNRRRVIFTIWLVIY